MELNKNIRKSVAIIPLRKGSKGIPGKNKMKILGRRLYQWCLGEAIFSKLDEVYIFTDDEEIIDQVEKEYHWTDKVKVIKRSAENANDIASTEAAMFEFAEKIQWDFEIICLLQATSPLTCRNDINNVLADINDNDFDSVLTVVKTKRFIWSEDSKSINYDYKSRPRRQDFEGLRIENGAVYASTKEQFLKSKNRLGGNISMIEMPEDTLTEIDEISDVLIIEKLLLNRLNSFKKSISKIKLLVLDVDGVFTPGTVGVTGSGELEKFFSLRDGMGLENLRLSGVNVIVMTSEDSPIVASRMAKLKLELYMGVKDKYSRLDNVLKQYSLTRNEVAYVGDDVNDLVNISSVLWGFCPNDAVNEVKPYCDFILNNNGGDQAIREACQFIINYNKRIIE
ncbi:cytidylyltransferase domain-containing protein [Polaribacter sp.]|uniref:cytidylyltransferase domain-containing protein n=1 Tax=Polaribacter sp. TaxID=1920175 RepID=UPI003EF8E08B